MIPLEIGDTQKIMLRSSGKCFNKKLLKIFLVTGRQVSVRKFIELSAKELGWGGIVWEGEGINEIGRRADTNEIVIKIDAKYFRPCEVNSLLGDANKAKNKLGWSPKTTLEELVSDMIKSDLELAKKESLLKRKGYEISFIKD